MHAHRLGKSAAAGVSRRLKQKDPNSHSARVRVPTQNLAGVEKVNSSHTGDPADHITQSHIFTPSGSCEVPAAGTGIASPVAWRPRTVRHGSPDPAHCTLLRSCSAAGPSGVEGVAFPRYSPRPRRRGLGARAVVAAAAPERFASGRSALAAPRGHGPVRALLLLSLSRDPHRDLGFTGSTGFVHVSNRGPGPQPGPWKGSGALGAASPGEGCGRPLACAPRAHSPVRGAGGGAR